ncbi:ABC transporter permease [Microbacterium sp. RD1]|uniref:ABC transporter permease n=1 Tax=Microbacterium sp. RD1 TaxID=3457313 RepID=UPI003FA5D670
MNAADLVTSALSNTFRSRTRSILTILAIFVGAFTLTLTNGVGTGISRYIDDTVASIGAQDVLTVTKTSETATAGAADSGPAEYDADAIVDDSSGPPGSESTVTALTAEDIATIEGIDGVVRAEAVHVVSTDFIRVGDGTPYVIGAGSVIPGQSIQLTAGDAPDDDANAYEVAIPTTYVEPLGFADADAAIGSTATLAISDSLGTQHEVEATIVGVAEQTFAPNGPTALPNEALSGELYSLQNTGVPAGQQDRFAVASVWFDPDATTEQVDALKADLSEEGYTGTTVADQLGAFTAVINGIVLVLNAFAIIALLAASFGIVNTLLMSVQERTREIGLMKAMGMGSGRVFSLFSLEAVSLGLFGSALGVILGIGVGSIASSALSGSLLAMLPGLTLLIFDPLSVAVIVLVVMGVAFLAGTLPAARAARADPVESLRYE